MQVAEPLLQKALKSPLTAGHNVANVLGVGGIEGT